MHNKYQATPMPVQEKGRSRGPLSPAGFWLRVFASILDSYITAFLCGLLLVVLGSAFVAIVLGSIANPNLASESWHKVVFALLLTWGFPFFYANIFIPFLECSPMQGSPGKWMFGIVVTDLEGRRVSFGRAFFRNFYKSLPWMLYFVVPLLMGVSLGLGGAAQLENSRNFIVLHLLVTLFWLYMFLRVAFSEHKQGLHDLWANCLVQVRYEVSFVWQIFLAIAVVTFPVWISFLLIPIWEQLEPYLEKELVEQVSYLKENLEEKDHSMVRADSLGGNQEVSMDLQAPEVLPPEETGGELLEPMNEVERKIPSQSQEESIQILRKKTATTPPRSLKKFISAPPFAEAYQEGRIELAGQVVDLDRIEISSEEGVGKSVLEIRGYAESFSEPAIEFRVLFRGNNHKCRNRALLGYKVEVFLPVFSLSTRDKYFSITRRASDLVLGEKFELSCRLGEEEWAVGDFSSAQAVLIGGARYPIGWSLRFGKQGS